MISRSAGGRPDSDDRSERHFLALGHQQCLDLMEAHHLGRVAWQAADLPQVLPVTYVMHQGAAYFRTRPIASWPSWPSRRALRSKWMSWTSRTGAAGAS